MFQLIYPYDPAPFLPLPTAEHPGGMNYAGGEMVPVVEPSGLVIGQTARSLAHGGPDCSIRLSISMSSIAMSNSSSRKGR